MKPMPDLYSCLASDSLRERPPMARREWSKLALEVVRSVTNLFVKRPVEQWGCSCSATASQVFLSTRMKAEVLGVRNQRKRQRRSTHDDGGEGDDGDRTMWRDEREEAGDDAEEKPAPLALILACDLAAGGEPAGGRAAGGGLRFSGATGGDRRRERLRFGGVELRACSEEPDFCVCGGGGGYTLRLRPPAPRAAGRPEAATQKPKCGSRRRAGGRGASRPQPRSGDNWRRGTSRAVGRRPLHRGAAAPLPVPAEPGPCRCCGR